MNVADATMRREAGAAPDAGSFRADCLRGLRGSPKAIPCKWLYDAEGSRLFELICDAPEYYVSRIETALLKRAVPALAELLPLDTALVEFGSGASRKTRILLDGLDMLTSYVPIDISASELARAAAKIERDYAWLEMFPLEGDFTARLSLDPALSCRHRLGFFPGSTFGNFTPREAALFLDRARDLLGSGSRLLIGIDLVKDAAALEAAYDDGQGLTAAFNRNLLVRANRELGATFDIEQFDHRAVWNAACSRVEMHLVSRTAQRTAVAGCEITFEAGETIHTENCYKVSEAALARMLERSGWSIEARWVSADPAYAVVLARG